MQVMQAGLNQQSSGPGSQSAGVQTGTLFPDSLALEQSPS